MHNEFEAPTTPSPPQHPPMDESWRLADPGTRFVAQFLDGLALIFALVPGAFLLMASASALDADEETMVLLGIPLVGGPYLGLLGYQWWYTAAEGTTIGKRANGIRIVRIDGSPMDFVHGVVLRSWVLALPRLLLGNLASVISLADALMVFSDRNRTLHDRIAGTVVIREPRR